MTPPSLPGAEARYPLLATPITLGGVSLRNRVVHASMTTRYAVDQRVTDRLIAYHANRAAGGCAMTITEPLAVLDWQVGETHKVRVYDDREQDGLARWAEAVERHDCRILGQIQDSGRGMHHKGRKAYSFGASALPDDLSWTVPHALDADQIARAIEQFGQAAKRLKRAGFSGVEISAGHGHLFHQFLSPHSNIREDSYGGDLTGRMRFLSETIAAVRAECGSPFIIAVKLPGDDGVPGGIGPDQAEAIVRRLVAAGSVDALTFAQGSHHRTLETHIPDLHEPRAPYNALTKRLRAAAGGTPVAALGRLLDAVQAEHAISDGVGDFVQIGRALITDAAWVEKSFAGREHTIRNCVSCNTCWATIADKAPIACDNNPRLGEADEAGWKPKPARAAKRVVIVGAGPAGLEAAWIAAERGHQVTVLGAGASYGGKAALLARLPGYDQISSVYDYQITMGMRAGARYEYGIEATAEDVLGLKPDAVVLATGSTQSRPPGLPQSWFDDGAILDLRATAAMLLDGVPRQPGTAVLYDADHTAGTYAGAELLTQIFERVVIATPRPQIAVDEGLVQQQGIHRRMAMLGVTILPFVEPSPKSALIDGIVAFANVYTGAITELPEVALLCYSTPRSPNDALAAPLRAAGLPLQLIGDCYAPRLMVNATLEGYQAGALL